MKSSEQCINNFVKGYSFRLDIRTLNLYQKAVVNFLYYYGKEFKEVTVRDIRNWLVYLVNNEYKPSTINIKLSGLKLFYKYCVEEGFVTHNPVETISLLKLEETIPHYLQLDQLAQLREMVKGQIKERAIIELLYATGMRISELASLKKEQINWEERMILIQRGKRKKDRIVLFTNYCAQYLQAYLKDRKDDLPYVFINTYGKAPVCIRTIQLAFQEYAKQIDIHFTPHTLRHTFAAHLAIKGMSLECIQILLGHEKHEQTQLYARLYNHARKLMYDEWM